MTDAKALETTMATVLRLFSLGRLAYRDDVRAGRGVGKAARRLRAIRRRMEFNRSALGMMLR